MINLGFIKKEDSEGILFLKEESKKPFQSGVQDLGAQQTGDPAALQRMQGQLQQAMTRIRELEQANYQLQKKP